jgi:hypothetical protein
MLLIGSTLYSISLPLLKRQNSERLNFILGDSKPESSKREFQQ